MEILLQEYRVVEEDCRNFSTVLRTSKPCFPSSVLQEGLMYSSLVALR